MYSELELDSLFQTSLGLYPLQVADVEQMVLQKTVLAWKMTREVEVFLSSLS